MIDANRGASEGVLQDLKEASYERMRIELFNAIEQLLKDFEMTWDDLASKLQWSKRVDGSPVVTYHNGQDLKRIVGEDYIQMEALNEIAHCFSAEVFFIFRPRFPYINT